VSFRSGWAFLGVIVLFLVTSWFEYSTDGLAWRLVSLSAHVGALALLLRFGVEYRKVRQERAQRTDRRP
jgi:hypothetical protein